MTVGKVVISIAIKTRIKILLNFEFTNRLFIKLVYFNGHDFKLFSISSFRFRCASFDLIWYY